MISVIKSDCELDTQQNSIKESKAEARVSRDNLEKARVLDNGGGSDEDVKSSVRVREDSNVDNEMEEESRVFELKNVKDSSFVKFDGQNDRFDPQDDEFEVENDGIECSVSRGDTKMEVYNSLLSEFDDYVANEKNGALEGTSRALCYGFEVGDMVWGKVKSHPWWPGHIFNEAFASSSVRRTRREGHVLVAFFGDSSYGWFDPAELIPFDPHFAEKSQQTSSRNFVKAVEEAVDEVSRRRGLGLACRCRNAHNFWPMNVQGYFGVDVPDYEPAGVYSASQIIKARDGFRPDEIVGFVKQLASAPRECDCDTIDFIKNKATVFSFRKAVYEEFDETYAQAFGVHASRPSKDAVNISDQPVKEPTRAPLSGPLVIAEALGGGKSSKKPMKVKDHSKKDRYLFKRRDDASDSKTLQIGQRQASASAPAVYVEGSSGGEYVLQKRAVSPRILGKHEQTGFICNEDAGPIEDVSGKEPLILDQASGHLGAPVSKGANSDTMLSLAKEKVVRQETKDQTVSDVVISSKSAGRSDLSGKEALHGVIDGTSSFQQEHEAVLDLRHEEKAKVSRSNEGSQQTELSFSARAEGDSGFDKHQDDRPSSHLQAPDAKRSVGMSADGGLKKAKVHKRPLGELSSEITVIGEKKKKKKKQLGAEIGPDRPKKHMATRKDGAVMGNLIGKSTQVSSAPREDPRANHQKKDAGITSSSLNSVVMSPTVGIGNNGLELRQLLSDLHGLALNPFHGAERNSPSITKHFFLQFRSLVYQKSLVLSPPPETEPVEVRTTKSPYVVGASDTSANDKVRDLTLSKPVKSLPRLDDPTKAGRKRLPSDRQEEIAAKRLKKLNQLKSLTVKKAGQRFLETPQAEGKEPVAAAPLKPVKLDSIKKMVSPARAVEPTMLVMKFPPQTSLPSAAELKARFARFGSIDQSAIRVFWKSSQCRVVFRHKADAQAAYKYAIKNNSLFGNVNVKYVLREVGAPGPEAPESDKGRGDDAPSEAPRVKVPVIERPAPALSHHPLSQSTVQLKSILKKPTGDDAGQVTGGNGGRGTPRVKFMLGGEETSRAEQFMVGNRNNFNNSASFADGGAPTSVAMDFNSKNFQKVIPPSPLPVLPLPPQFATVPLNNSRHAEVATRNLHNLNALNAAPITPSIDISQQMLSLLTRCNDVVTTVTGLLGYLPYHPL